MCNDVSKYRYLDFIAGLFATLLIVSNLCSTRIVDVGWLTFDAGTLIFPLTYIFNDLLTEVYGYKRSRRVIWIGFLALAVSAGSIALISLMPPAAGWGHARAWEAVMGQVPRIVLGSLLAFFSGGFVNSYVLAKLKVKTGGRRLWLRLIGSTMIGQLFDTLIFASIAFIGVLSWPLWTDLVLSNYIFKVGVEILLLPLTCLVVRRVKKIEGLDVYDTDTSFSPFRLDV